MYVKNSKSILLLCVMALSLVAGSAQAREVIIKEPYSGSKISGYLKYAAALGSGLGTVGAGWLTFLAMTSNNKNSLIPFSRLKVIVVPYGVLVTLCGAWATKLILKDAHREFQAVKQEEDENLAQVFVAAQQQASESQSYQRRYY